MMIIFRPSAENARESPLILSVIDCFFSFAPQLFPLISAPFSPARCKFLDAFYTKLTFSNTNSTNSLQK